VLPTQLDVEAEVSKVLAASNHLERSTTSAGWLCIETFKEGGQIQIQSDSANCILVSRIDDPEVIQHRRRTAEVKFPEFIEQAAANDVNIDLSTEEIECCCFLRSILPVWITEFTAFLPWHDRRAFLRTATPVADHMLIDLISRLDGQLKETA
jgi:hypothetical protein